MNSLKKWSDVTNLSFKELTTGEPDIWFKFVRGAHGDPYPFEETGGTTIAHGFYPGDGAFRKYLFFQFRSQKPEAR